MKKTLAVLLVLCLLLSLTPVTVSAAASRGFGAVSTDSVETSAVQEPVQTNGSHTISKNVTGSSYGEVTLYSTSANTGDTVRVCINPKPGYLASINYDYYYTYYEASMSYVGNDIYELYVGDGDVTINVEFYAASGTSHSVTCSSNTGGSVRLNQTSGKPDESIIMNVTINSGYELSEITYATGTGEYLAIYTISESTDSMVLEFFMPDTDVELNFEFQRTGVANAITLFADGNRGGVSAGGTVTSDVSAAYEGDTVTLTITPALGYKLNNITCPVVANFKSLGNNKYSFTMPKYPAEIYVTFVENYHDLFVYVDTGLGGTATLSTPTARVGDTVTLECYPQEGYRVAQITGVSGIVDNGNNTYSFTMPDQQVLLHVLFLRNENPFVDVNERNFFYNPVLWAVENKITSGMTSTTFCPNNACTRGQVVTFLWRYAGSPEPTTTTHPFTDVNPKAFYYKAMLWAVENGITAGLTPTTFGSDQPCTRGQVVTFLYRALGKPAVTSTSHSFTDVNSNAFYYKAMLWAVENKITSGMTATTFCPNDSCTRGQVVTFLYRADNIS